MIRRLLERSLLMQVILILLAVLISFVLLIHTLFQSNIAFFLLPKGLENNAVPITKLVEQLDQVSAENAGAILDVYASEQRFAGIAKEFPHDAKPSEPLRKVLESRSSAAKALADRDVRFRTLTSSKVINSPLRGNSGFSIAALEISVELGNGRIAYFWLSPSTVLYSRQFGMLPLFVSLMLAVAALGVLLVRTAFRPLKSLEIAAAGFDGTLEPELIPELGPSEVKQLARSLNEMQSRIHGLVQERAFMIAAIAHDVRTALARIRLRLDSHDLEDAGIEEDLDQITVMMDDMVTFARPARASKLNPEILALDQWLADYANNSPYDVCLRPGEHQRVCVSIQERALRRAIDNLVDNANRYATGAFLQLKETADGWAIEVRDEGPGVPDAEITKLFTPFHRLEYSRNRGTGGSGLGLGIARELIRGEGGEVTLRNSPAGGLVATIYLPNQLQICDE
jgi:signal transduction histidine kinase